MPLSAFRCGTVDSGSNTPLLYAASEVLRRASFHFCFLVAPGNWLKNACVLGNSLFVPRPIKNKLLSFPDFRNQYTSGRLAASATKATVLTLLPSAVVLKGAEHFSQTIVLHLCIVFQTTLSLYDSLDGETVSTVCSDDDLPPAGLRFIVLLRACYSMSSIHPFKSVETKIPMSLMDLN
jgi:hypothetical protein